MTEVSVCRKDGAREPRWNCRALSEPFLETDKLPSLWSRPQDRLRHRLRHFLFSSLCTWGEGEAMGKWGSGKRGSSQT